jgi:aminoglycoside 2'-N-acetyltransferase I
MVDVRVFADEETPSDLVTPLRRFLVETFRHFSDEDWEHTHGGWRVVALDGADPVAHAAVVPRVMEVAEHPFRTGYVEGVATERARQGDGLGSRVMTEATAIVWRRFELGALSTNRWAFYQRLGWERWQGPTFVRTAGELVRTPDEDDGVMVLRFGPSLAIDLAAPISCDARPGDDW